MDHRWQLDLPDEPVVVPGDAPRLTQVLTNLLANARTHTPAGTTVTVGLARGDGGARLTVADDGPGIAPDLLPHVFERFARGIRVALAARPAARGWAWRSSTPSWPPTAARERCRAGPGARSSRCGCRRRVRCRRERGASLASERGVG